MSLVKSRAKWCDDRVVLIVPNLCIALAVASQPNECRFLTALTQPDGTVTR